MYRADWKQRVNAGPRADRRVSAVQAADRPGLARAAAGDVQQDAGPGHRVPSVPATGGPGLEAARDGRREAADRAGVRLFRARSGSTLVRVILGSHSQLYAPPELPLKRLGVRADTQWIQASLDGLELTTGDLEHMLWDRVLAEALRRSGKPQLVVETPSNVLVWERIAAAWPDAQFVFLLRHPAAAVASLHSSFDPAWRPEEAGSIDESVARGLRYMNVVEEARQALPGFTVRYRGADRCSRNRVVRGCASSWACRSSRRCWGPERRPCGLAPGLGGISLNIPFGPRPSAPRRYPTRCPPGSAGIGAASGYPHPDDQPATSANRYSRGFSRLPC